MSDTNRVATQGKAQTSGPHEGLYIDVHAHVYPDLLLVGVEGRRA